MRKVILLTVLFLFSGYSIFAQDAKTDKKGKKKQKTETVSSHEGDDNATSLPPTVEDDEDDDGGGNYVPSLLHSSRDVYSNNTSYTFSIAYFKPRGYDNRYGKVFANGYDMNSPVTGRATYSQWGGLNHIFR